MGQDSKIEWTDHTFNPWVGCAKVSAACTNCYAEGWAKRTGQAGLWRGERRRTSVANWRQPLKWNRETPGARVFCASLADVFEQPADQLLLGKLEIWRTELWDLIEQTPALTWLLLTKRPEYAAAWISRWGCPSNVWVGTTVEDQQRADERIPHLLRIPARVRFLSCEPLLGPVDLSPWLGGPVHIDQLTRTCGHFDGGSPVNNGYGCRHPAQEEREDGHGKCFPFSCPIASRLYPDEEPEDAAILARNGLAGEGGEDWLFEAPGIQWVIAGGESGPRARPSHPAWFRSLRDQCVAAGVPFHFKQWGEFGPEPEEYRGREMCGLLSLDGRWDSTDRNGVAVRRLGKAAAGRELDGRTWDEVPAVPLPAGG